MLLVRLEEMLTNSRHFINGDFIRMYNGVITRGKGDPDWFDTSWEYNIIILEGRCIIHTLKGSYPLVKNDQLFLSGGRCRFEPNDVFTFLLIQFPGVYRFVDRQIEIPSVYHLHEHNYLTDFKLNSIYVDICFMIGKDICNNTILANKELVIRCVSGQGSITTISEKAALSSGDLVYLKDEKYVINAQNDAVFQLMRAPGVNFISYQ